MGTSPSRHEYVIAITVTIGLTLLLTLGYLWWAAGPTPASIPFSSAVPSALHAPLPPQAEDPDSETVAYNQACDLALTSPFEKSLEIYQGFIDRYPTSKLTPIMLNRLGDVQARLNHFPEAFASLGRAKSLLGNDRFANTVELNIAELHLRAGHLAEAETHLQTILALPTPKAPNDAYAYIPQAFAGPMLLAKLRIAQGRPNEATTILKETADKAIDLTKEFPNVAWIPSYAGQAYYIRLEMLIAAHDYPAGKALAEEWHARLPNYQGPCDYFSFLSSLETATQLAEQIAGGSTSRP